MLQAVSTDTFGGLSGYKRPNQGNPTRIPSNQPAFRGVNNKPGSDIRAPAIKSSANRNNRGTNVQIPYARETLIDPVADVGRLKNGDVAFVSRTRHEVPGYAHSRYSRLLGVDALNRAMGPAYWDVTTETGKHRYLLIDSKNPADDWRSVPTLQEWALDGVVLSSEASETFYNHAEGKRDNQLYNIAIQGPTPVNNGFVEEFQSWDQMARMQQGLPSQLPSFHAAGTERRSGVLDDLKDGKKWDFAADYNGPNYHLYPLQMFDRNIGVLNELYVGLVCTEYKLDGTDTNILSNMDNVGKLTDQMDQLLKKLDATEATKANTAMASKNRANAINRQRKGINKLKRALFGRSMKNDDIRKMIDDGTFEEAIANAFANTLPKLYRARSAFQSMGWWDGAKVKVDKKEGGIPKQSFCAYRYVLFTSAQALELDNDPMMPNDKRMAMPDGEQVFKKRRPNGDVTPFDNFEQRKEDFRHMVGAWKVGNVMDMKAATMPSYGGGPVDAGFRVTVNVNVDFLDWRALRRMYTPAGINGTQICEAFVQPWKAKPNSQQEPESTVILKWPTVFNSEKPDDNKPYDPQHFYEGKDKPVKDKPGTDPPPTQGGGGSSADTGASIRRGRLSQLVVVPEVAPEHADDIDKHEESLDAALANLRILLAPITEEEIAAHHAGLALPPVAAMVMAPTSLPATTSLPTPTPPPETAETAAAAGAMRRRPGSTPSPSPGRAVAEPLAVGPSAPVASQPTNVVANPGIEAPSAPPSTQRKRRQPTAVADPFSQIFGGESSDVMQPLNPAHRSDGSGGSGGAAGASGRSYQRRGKGGSGSKD